MARIKRRHFVDTDKIYSVQFVERRKVGYIKLIAKIDGQRQEVELTEDEYGKMLQNGYYES